MEFHVLDFSVLNYKAYDKFRMINIFHESYSYGIRF